jgi:endonuclease YncB( thermonuclease family)
MKFIAILLGFVLCASTLASPGNVYHATVKRVVDGDTIDVRAELWPQFFIETRIRLAGIDTPELHGKCPEERDSSR